MTEKKNNLAKYGITTLAIIICFTLLDVLPVLMPFNSYIGAILACIFFFYFFYQYIKHNNYLAVLGVLLAMGGSTSFGGQILDVYNGIWLVGVNFLICLIWYILDYRKKVENQNS